VEAVEVVRITEAGVLAVDDRSPGEMTFRVAVGREDASNLFLESG
jgi:hypothetical protein